MVERVLIRWPDGHEDWREYDRPHLRPALDLCPVLDAEPSMSRFAVLPRQLSVTRPPAVRPAASGFYSLGSAATADDGDYVGACWRVLRP